jgi:hypothetical protein
LLPRGRRPLVDKFDDEVNTLTFSQAEVVDRPKDSVGVDGFSALGHGRVASLLQSYCARQHGQGFPSAAPPLLTVLAPRRRRLLSATRCLSDAAASNPPVFTRISRCLFLAFC